MDGQTQESMAKSYIPRVNSFPVWNMNSLSFITSNKIPQISLQSPLWSHYLGFLFVSSTTIANLGWKGIYWNVLNQNQRKGLQSIFYKAARAI